MHSFSFVRGNVIVLFWVGVMLFLVSLIDYILCYSDEMFLMVFIDNFGIVYVSLEMIALLYEYWLLYICWSVIIVMPSFLLRWRLYVFETLLIWCWVFFKLLLPFGCFGVQLFWYFLLLSCTNLSNSYFQLGLSWVILTENWVTKELLSVLVFLFSDLFDWLD